MSGVIPRCWKERTGELTPPGIKAQESRNKLSVCGLCMGFPYGRSGDSMGILKKTKEEVASEIGG
jgi:hypothetical protein